MNTQRILLVHNVISPHTDAVFRELAKLTDLHVLYCAENESNRSWDVKPKGYSYSILPSSKIEFKGRDLFTLFINRGVFKSISAFNPSVIIICGWDLPTYWLTCLYAKIKRKPYILWAGSTNNEKSWRRTISTPLVRAIVAGAKGYLSYGTRSKEYLMSLGADALKVHIVFNGFDMGNFASKNHSAKPGKIKRIVFYGQLIERKKPSLLIKAFKVVKKKIGSVELIIAGTGNLRSKLTEQIRELSLEQSVHLIDSASDSVIQKYLRSASLFVLPSSEEVWGLAVNIAMATGVPAITSDAVGCADDLIIPGETGYVFRSNDETDLAEKIIKILSNNILQRKMAQNAKNLIRICDAPVVASRIANATTSILSNAPESQKIIQLQTITDDCHLTVLTDVKAGHPMKRIYYIYDSLEDAPRGFHAHYKNSQSLICLQGSADIVMDDGRARAVCHLASPTQALSVPPMVWHEMHSLTKETILLVVASDQYNEKDYIRRYGTFISSILSGDR